MVWLTRRLAQIRKKFLPRKNKWLKLTLRAVVQRVTSASVSVLGKVSRIGRGLVVFVGVARDDEDEAASYIVNKIVNLRIFADGEGRFDLSAIDTHAQLLVISQFTLYGDTRKGRRPSFTDAAPPEQARIIFQRTVGLFRETGLVVETGQFQQSMLVDLQNDGPVTIILDSDNRSRPRRA